MNAESQGGNSQENEPIIGFLQNKEIVDTVDQHRQQESDEEKAPSFQRLKFGLAGKIAHHDCESGVGRHCREGPKNDRLHSKAVGIKDIFQRGEPHRDDHSVDDAVDRLVEENLPEGVQDQRKKLDQLFAQGYDHKGGKQRNPEVLRVVKAGVVRPLFQLQYGKGNEHTQGETQVKMQRRFLLILIHPVDEPAEEQTGADCYQKEQKIHTAHFGSGLSDSYPAFLKIRQIIECEILRIEQAIF